MIAKNISCNYDNNHFSKMIAITITKDDRDHITIVKTYQMSPNNLILKKLTIHNLYYS